MERLATVLPPLAEGCHRLGLPFGIENHGDYYCSDLVGLCEQVPHLGIFLDTGNTYLIGEAPLPAFRAAAPYVVGAHFKDHHVRPCPDARPLHFEVAPAVLGEGDVGLRECYEILLREAPRPHDLVMEMELIPPQGMPPLEAFERSLAFVRSLEETVHG
jgi:sugar phosphate isomerase/epimerase